MASIKKKRVSKKTKASWRKHTDIQDVEDFLDEQRQEERIGLFAGLKDEELFRYDAAPEPKRTILTEKVKRKMNAKRPLKSLAALQNTSKVQDPIRKRNIVKQKKNGRNIEDEILYPRSQKHIQANKDRLKYNNALDKKLQRDRGTKDFTRDIWSELDIRNRMPGLDNQWINKNSSLHVLRNVGKPAVKVHDSLRHKTTKAKAFEPPHPGTSYNPSLPAHQDLIQDVVEREEDIIKTEQHLKRVTTDMFRKVTPAERDQRRLEEMSSGLVWDETDESDEQPLVREDGGGDGPYKAVNPPVQNKKKPKKKIRKQKEQKKQAAELQKKKELRKLGADIHSIKKLSAEVIDDEEKLNEMKKKRKRVALKKKFGTKRLGRVRYRPIEPEVTMPEEIPGNLRNVRNVTGLLVDRFKNFQKRNLIPASVEVSKPKRRKIKRFTRSSHKEPGVSTFKKKKI